MPNSTEKTIAALFGRKQLGNLCGLQIPRANWAGCAQHHGPVEAEDNSTCRCHE
jgi:hypothetical protein